MSPGHRARFDLGVFAAAGVLLLSMGGAVVAAPVSVPLVVRAVRRQPGRAWRPAGALLGAATLAEVAWAVTYVTVGESGPWIWLLPLVAAGVMAWSILRLPGAGVPPRPMVSATSR